MLAIATTSADLERLRSRLESVDVARLDTVEPGLDRLVLLVRLVDETSSEGLAAALRAEGEHAVTRPTEGAQLRAWQRDTAPVTVANRVTMCLAWSEHDRADLPGLVELAPGGFGSGHHPTTRLIVEELVARIRGGERVLDVGSGSGVLGLCALRLGASELVATDLKQAAVRATEASAAINGMSDAVEATTDGLAAEAGAFDVVVANIARAGVVEVAPQLIDRTAPNGWLAVSGIAESQCDQIGEFLRPLVEVERRTSGEWAMSVFEHR